MSTHFLLALIVAASACTTPRVEETQRVRAAVDPEVLAVPELARLAREEIDTAMAELKYPPICNLNPTPYEQNSRRAQLIPRLIERAEQVSDLENGLRLRLASSPGLLAELAAIVDSERTCCSSLRFQVTAEPVTGPVIFEVTGPPGTRELLRSL